LPEANFNVNCEMRIFRRRDDPFHGEDWPICLSR
jgi:hypothetical protein